MILLALTGSRWWSCWRSCSGASAYGECLSVLCQKKQYSVNANNSILVLVVSIRGLVVGSFVGGLRMTWFQIMFMVSSLLDLIILRQGQDIH